MPTPAVASAAASAIRRRARLGDRWQRCASAGWSGGARADRQRPGSAGEPADLARELQWLKRHSRRILWLNPLLRFDGYAPSARGAAELFKAADGMLAVHNVQRLQELAGGIAKLMNS